MNGSRPVLEPKGRVDRVLYAFIMFTGPCIIMSPAWAEDDLLFPLGIITFWWVICTFYTLDALLDRLERWRRAP